MGYDLLLVAGNANRPLALEIAARLGVALTRADVSRFADGEVCVHINDSVRGGDVFVIQPTCPPVNENLMELLVLLDALKRSSARRITAVLPYYAYARQDLKVRPRVPISGKLVADLLTTAGADRILALDLHSGQIQGFFDIPVDHLYSTPVLISYLQGKGLLEPVVVSPDAAGVERARVIAKRLRAGLAIVDKRRDDQDAGVFMHVIGDVAGRDAIIVDDMIDTAGRATQAADAVKREGARRILVWGVHALLSGSAVARLASAPVEEVIVSNSIPLPSESPLPNITVLSIAGLLAEAIRRIHCEESVSSLFE